MVQAKLNHIGIAVSQLPELKKLFSILGLSVDHTERVEDQGVITHFVPLPVDQTQLEFLEPFHPESAVAKFLAKRGPGIHHLSFELPSGSLESISQQIQAAGFQLIYPAPRAGAHGMRINFIHPASAGGMLIEIMERA